MPSPVPEGLFKYVDLANLRGILRKYFKSLGVEEVDVANSVGRFLAEDLTAPRDLPEYDISHVDGFALSSCSGLSYRLVMGSALGRCEATYVRTGEPVPEGTVAVLPVEAARVVGGEVIAPRFLEEGSEIIRRGLDVARSDIVARRGSAITPAKARLLAELGFSTLKVFVRPKVLVVPVGTELAEGSRRETSSLVVRSMCEPLASGVTVSKPVEDSTEVIREVVGVGVEEYDAVVTIGGASLGDKDLTFRTVSSLDGVEVLVRGVAVQPGRVTSLVSLRGKPVVLLPGLIQSTVSGAVFVLQPLLKVMQGGDPVAHYLTGLLRLGHDYTYRGRFTAFTRLRFVKLINEEEGTAEIFEAPSPVQRPIAESHGFTILEPGVVKLAKYTLIRVYRAPGLY
jgi:molybdopterin biosynthesis enzyme